MNIKIVADSSADIFTMQNTNYVSVPLTLSAENREFTDDATLSIEEMTTFFKSIKSPSRSSCPNIEDYLQAYRGGNNLLVFPITKSLSGSYNAARLALDMYTKENPGVNGYVVDTLSCGPEVCLLMEKAAQLSETETVFSRITEKINAYKENTHLLFCLQSLRNLANNGRVSMALAKLSGFLGIRIIGKASPEGTVALCGKARGEKSALTEIFKIMEKDGYQGGKVRIHHCNNISGAAQLAHMIKNRFPKCVPVFEKTRGICSFYAESGGLLIGYETI